MTFKRLSLVSLLLVLMAGCPSKKDSSPPQDWVYGTWVTEKVSTDILETHSKENTKPLTRHAIVFERNGDIKRISENKAMARLLMDFRMSGSLLEMAPMDTENFMVYGKKLSENSMKMFVTQDGYFLYRKLDRLLTEADLEGSPVPDTP